MKKILNFMIIVLAFTLLSQTPLSVMAQTKLAPSTKNEGSTNNKSKSDNKGKSDNINKSTDKDIIETAREDGRFKTLISAIDAAGLTQEFKEDGPFTVFAPTDEAFSKLPAGTLDDLLKPENKSKLADIISYHVSKEIMNSKELNNLDGKEIQTLNNDKKSLIVTKKDDTLFINSSKIIVADIYSKNGIIHVIDAVLIPQ